MAAVRAYAGGATSWARDATPVYAPLARYLLAALPLDVGRRRVLDAGAGTGVVGDLLRDQGARVTAVDLEPDMVEHLTGKGPAVLADVRRMPFSAQEFDLSVAAFLLNHLADPVAGLAELARVTAADGWVLTSVFGNDRPPAKDLIDAVAADFGYAPPRWYVQQRQAAERTGTVSGLSDAARRAGLRVELVDERPVDTGLSAAGDVVRYRCALPQLRPFVASLDPVAQRAFRAAAAAALSEVGTTFCPVVLRLLAQPAGPG